jgi:hypothetical protein
MLLANWTILHIKIVCRFYVILTSISVSHYKSTLGNVSG